MFYDTKHQLQVPSSFIGLGSSISKANKGVVRAESPSIGPLSTKSSPTTKPFSTTTGKSLSTSLPSSFKPVSTGSTSPSCNEGSIANIHPSLSFPEPVLNNHILFQDTTAKA
eukprot:TRINITY_DN7349_c0_g1_i1.p2 TRINITY_DN7349_c0_g1~~TRINITY_DN7349_c0_g1_i1.p2  ORF type:complete len:112 (+),score=23.06 TRINITY_DN7349_c0_g1_i1:25-360(+)